MEIIARIVVYKNDARNLKERKFCRGIIKQYKDYIVEKDRCRIEFHIPTTVEGCMELVAAVTELEDAYDEDVNDEDEDCCVTTLLPLKKYAAEDYQKAVAFNVLWGDMVFGYETKNKKGVFWKPCCENARWYDGGSCGVQIGNYRMSKSKMKNKKCAITGNYDYVVNDTVKNIMMQHGAEVKDFYPVLTDKDELV